MEIRKAIKRTIATVLTAAALSAPVYARDHAVRVGAPAQPTAQSADAAAFLDNLADVFRAHVPRSDGYKWGWEVKIQQYCPDLVEIKVENEQYPECPTGPDPTRLLTTYWRMDDSCGILGVRDDLHTALVDSPADIDFMELYDRVNPTIALNNLSGDVTSPFPAQAEKYASASQLSDLGISANPVMECTSPLIVEEQRLMNAAVRAERNPWSVLTIRPVGTAPDGEGIFELVDYRIDENGDKHRMITSTINFATGDWSRDDSRSDLKDQCSAAGFYAKVKTWVPQRDGSGKIIGESETAAIDNCKNGGAGGHSYFDKNRLQKEFFGNATNYWNP